VQAGAVPAWLTAQIRLVGAHEIRVRLGGVSRQRAYQIISRADFLRPVAGLWQGKAWRTGDVDHWIREHRPEPN
jgi:predicted DNA-binding transcriptional regulator AlpA